MAMIWIALAVMVASTLIVNLGLGDAIADVSGKILKCSTCLTFWGTLITLYCYKADIITMLVLSIFMAYLSNYFGLILSMLNKLYDRLWVLINKKAIVSQKKKNK
ncbi:MAG: hypothetical protein ACI4N3_01885 [Alphaproteobacteria bacterium]